MAIQFFDGECFDLTSSLRISSKILPVGSESKSRLCSKLKDDDHTYLTIKSARGVEIVKATCVDGDIVIERAQGDTEAMNFGIDTCACFIVNRPVLDDWFDEMRNGGCKPKVVSGDDFIVVEHDEENCTFTISVDEDIAECLTDLCLDRCGTCVLPDGTYENPTVTVREGKVCGISNGRNILYVGGSCCSCNDEGREL